MTIEFESKGDHAMSQTHEMPQTNQNHEPRDRYFSFQIKGWTNFDPMDKTLARLAESIDQGNGFLTLVEVLTVEDDLASIQDEEVRTCFENLLAAKRLMRNFNELPPKIKEELRAVALRTEEEVAPKNIVTLVPGSSASPEAAAVVKRWP
jgi:hypothetical protein